MPVLDRIPSVPDPVRFSLYDVADLEVTGGTIAELSPRSYSWGVPFHLDQGSEGACVAHGVVHEAIARPKPVNFKTHELPGWATATKAMQEGPFGPKPIAQRFAFESYDWCRDNDEWAGRNYSGTSAAAGAKMAVSAGLWGEYRWATSVRDFMTAVSRHGPGCMAIDWYTGMMSPDSDGFIHPTGRVEGGHQIMVMAISTTLYKFPRPALGLWQSWGDSPVWWIYQDELEQVVANHGEMVVPIIRNL